MFKIKGLDKLTRELSDLSKAAEDLGGELGSFNFDPNDPFSIEQAIKRMEAAVDAKVSAYERSELVASLAESMKAQGREAILQRAAEGRIRGNIAGEQ